MAEDRLSSQGSDFETWKTAIDAILRAKDLEDFQYCHAKIAKFRDQEHHDPKTKDLESQREALCTVGEKLDPDAKDYAAKLQDVMLERRRYDALVDHREARPGKAAKTMLNAVAQSLRFGVAQELATKPYALWKALEQQSKPFRFLDLPAEMQNRTTALTLANGDQSIEAPQPGITRVNRQIRRETLPMYYTTTTFHIHPRKADKSLHGNAKTLGAATEMMVSQWVERSVRDHAKHLRRVVLHLDYQARGKKQASNKAVGGTDKMIGFVFTDESGLRVVADSTCNTKFKTQNLQIAAERQRKMLKLSGDSIVFALLHNIDLWNNGGLEWKT